MNPENDPLLRDILDEEEASAQREAVLLAGGRILRRRRFRAVASRIALGLAAAAACVGIAYLQARPSTPAAVAKAVPPESHVEIIRISDQELLAMFPGTPVAIGKANGKTVLIFPRPEDEARWVARGP